MHQQEERGLVKPFGKVFRVASETAVETHTLHKLMWILAVLQLFSLQSEWVTCLRGHNHPLISPATVTLSATNWL